MTKRIADMTPDQREKKRASDRHYAAAIDRYTDRRDRITNGDLTEADKTMLRDWFHGDRKAMEVWWTGCIERLRLASEPRERRGGRCYELAGRAVLFDDTDRLVLVHGVIYISGVPAAHAWVFDSSDGLIYDAVLDRWGFAWSYNAAYHAVEEVRYSRREMAALVAVDGHFGPWHVTAGRFADSRITPGATPKSNRDGAGPD